MSEPPLVVGVGTPFRGDDGAGPEVARRVADAGGPALVHEGDGTGLIDLFGHHPRLVLVDAMQSGGPPGRILRLDASATPLPAQTFRYSTHRFGLAEAVETARALGGLPDALDVIGIEGADFRPGLRLTAPVARAVDEIVAELARRPQPSLPRT